MIGSVIAVATDLPLATWIVNGIGLFLLPLFVRLVVLAPPALRPEPRSPIDTVWPVPVGCGLFILNMLLRVVALRFAATRPLLARATIGVNIAIALAIWAKGMPRIACARVGALQAVLYGLLAVLAAIPVVNGIAYVEQIVFGELPLQEPVKRLIRGGPGTLELAFWAIAVAPLMEELIFRGLLYNGFRRARSPRYALIVTSVAFGIVHMDSLAAIVPLAVLALFLGFTMERTGSLLACFVGHAAFNTLTIVTLFLT